MKDPKVAAVIVSFNPGRAFRLSLHAVVNQVCELIVVDNGSKSESRDVVAGLRDGIALTLIQLKTNVGIAEAQNVGVAHAIRRGAEWILMLDQDSLCSDGMVHKLLQASISHTGRPVGFASPRIAFDGVDVNKGEGAAHVIGYAISSGALYPVEALARAGRQRSEYFIDSVDFEYSLRLRSLGFDLLRVESAVLHHSLGEREYVRLLGRTFGYVVHPPFRRYYMARNHVFLAKQYSGKFLTLMIKKSFFMLLLVVQVVLVEKNKRGNLSALAHGFIDGIRGHGGKYSSQPE